MQDIRVQSIDELTTVDVRAKVFAGRLDDMQPPSDPEVVRRLQEGIAVTDLVAAVPSGVRDNFERLRSMHVHGALLYDLYTVVEQTHVFVLEQALGERFMEQHGPGIPFVNKAGKSAPLEANSFREVSRALRRGGSHHQTRELLIDDALFEVSASFYGLLRWARKCGFLRGQRNRFREDCLRELRNEFAHPSGHSLTGPVESARAISGLAETINHLWGHTTEGGSRYPPPLVREILVVGRSVDGEARTLGYPEAMTNAQAHSGWDYYVVRATRENGSLMEADPPFEQTNLPMELLWGPGSADDALHWIGAEQPQPDTIEHLDRLFWVDMDATEFPREIDDESQATSVPADREWTLIRADFPRDAVGHVRGLLEVDSKHSKSGYCPECAIQNVETPQAKTGLRTRT
jgi:hypothetical protein